MMLTVSDAAVDHLLDNLPSWRSDVTVRQEDRVHVCGDEGVTRVVSFVRSGFAARACRHELTMYGHIVSMLSAVERAATIALDPVIRVEREQPNLL